VSAPDIAALAKSLTEAQKPSGQQEPSHSVNDISDAELLERAVRAARPSRKSPRWTAVSDTFCLGSTYSMQLCRRFGLDPDETIGRRR
jgi:hypothetical protein